MKNWIFIVCIALLSASCNSILNSKPTGMLSEKQMIDVLVDINLTEAALKTGDDSIARKGDTTELRERFAEVFKKNDIEPDRFNNSLNYYLKHIDELDKIYVEVINRLTALEATLIPKPLPESNRLNKSGTGYGSAAYMNPWFRSMNKMPEPEEIQYFDSHILSVKNKNIYPGPLK